MKKILFIISILSVLSCTRDYKEKIIYDSSGNVISKMYYNAEKKLDSVILLKDDYIFKNYYQENNAESRYCKVFDLNGSLFSEGNCMKDNKIGKWKFYDSKDRIRKVVEFKTICDEEYPNQEWNYNEKGVLENERSNYFSHFFEFPKFTAGKENLLTIKYVPFIKDAAVFLYFSPEYSADFCNVDEVEGNLLLAKKDSIFFEIKTRFQKKGNYNFKGYILEEIKNPTAKNPNNYSSKITYITIPIDVN